MRRNERGESRAGGSPGRVRGGLGGLGWDDGTWTPRFWGAKLEGVDDIAAQRLAEALEAAANPKPKTLDRRTVDTPEARHDLFGDPASPFRTSQERKRTYLAREDGRRDPRA